MHSRAAKERWVNWRDFWRALDEWRVAWRLGRQRLPQRTPVAGERLSATLDLRAEDRAMPSGKGEHGEIIGFAVATDFSGSLTGAQRFRERRL